MSHDRRLSRVISLWSVAGVCAFAILSASGVSGETLREVYQEYTGAVRRGEEVDLRMWAERFGTALDSDSGTDVQLRLRVMDERGAVLRETGQIGESSRTYEQMLAYATRVGDYDGGVTALQNLLAIGTTIGQQPEQVLALYDSYQDKLRNAPAVSADRSARLLVDSYYNRARYAERCAESETNPARKAALLESAANGFSLFLTNVRPDSVNKPDVARYRLAGCLKALGRKEEAGRLYTELSETSSEFPPSWMFHEGLKCTASVMTDEYQSALAEYLRTHKQDDYYRSAYQALAMSYLGTGKAAMAIPILRELLAGSEGGDVQAYNTYLLGASYIESGAIDRGIAVLEDLLQTWPDSPSADLAEMRIRQTSTGFESAVDMHEALMAGVRNASEELMEQSPLDPLMPDREAEGEKVTSVASADNGGATGMRGRSAGADRDTAVGKGWRVGLVVAALALLVLGVTVAVARKRGGRSV